MSVLFVRRRWPIDLRPRPPGLRPLAVLALTLLAALLAPSARGQQPPVPMPLDTRLVVFRYHPDESYVVLTRPGAVTHVALEPDETITAFALGDTVQWIVQERGPHLFVKPVRAGLFTSATLVTSRRVYQLALRSGPEDGAWYQRVSWSHPAVVVAGGTQVPAPVSAPASGATSSSGLPALDLARMEFGYRIDGEAAFRPAAVFDDGRFTWFRLPAGLSELPALFAVTPDADGEAGELVNYLARGRWLVAQRVAPRFLLRLGREQVRVVRDAAGSRAPAAAWAGPASDAEGGR